MSSLKKFASQTAIYGLSTMLSRVLNFVLTPLYVRLYNVQVYGIFTYMYSWASMVNSVLAFGMETTFFRYLHKHEDQKEKIYNNTIVVVASAALLFLFFAIFFVEDIVWWMRGTRGDHADFVSYVQYFIYILVVDALAVIPFAKVRADGRSIRYGLIKLINILIFVGFNFFFLLLIPYLIQSEGFLAPFFSTWYRPQWIAYIFISNLIASIATLLLLLPELIKFRLKCDPKLLLSMLLYSLPILIANISFIINENMDKIFLEILLPKNVGQQQVGIYGACCKLAIFLNIFIQAFRLGAEPFFFSQAKATNARKTYARIMNYFVIVVCLIFIVLTANIEILKYFIRGNTIAQQALYWSGLDVVPILLFAYVSLGIYMNLSIWYKLSDQTRFGLYIAVFGAILTILLNVLFIPSYGYMASAWISLIVYAIMMMLSYYLGQRNYPIPYHLKKNLAYLSLAITIVYLSFIVFHRDLLIGNLLALLFLIIVFYVERKGIGLINSKKTPYEQAS